MRVPGEKRILGFDVCGVRTCVPLCACRWMNGVMARGFAHPLRAIDLPSLHPDEQSQNIVCRAHVGEVYSHFPGSFACPFPLLYAY